MKMSEVKKVIAEQIPVKFKDITYYTTACIMRLRNSKWVYFLELHDLKANSVIIAPLDKVDIM